MIRLIGWDLDDTLVDDMGATQQGLSELAEYLGIRDLERLSEQWSIASDYWFEQYLAGHVSLEENRIRRIIETASACGIAMGNSRALQAFTVYRTGYERGWQPFWDTISFLQKIRSLGIPVGIVTNGDGPTQRRKLAVAGIDRWVSIVLISGEFGAAKPDPSIFRQLLNLAGCQPHESVFVGDRVDKDILPARALGMHAFHINRGSQQSGDIKNLLELGDALKALDPHLSSLGGMI